MCSARYLASTTRQPTAVTLSQLSMKRWPISQPDVRPPLPTSFQLLIATMDFTIEFSARAVRDVDQIVGYIATDSPRHAHRWRKDLEDKCRNISVFPAGFPLAPENADRSFEIRQAVFGAYRILFTVRKESAVIWILTVRHVARLPLQSTEMIDTGH